MKDIENISRAIDNILIKNLEDDINKKKILPNIEKNVAKFLCTKKKVFQNKLTKAI